MRSWRGSARLALAFIASFVASGAAEAQLLVAAKPSDTPAVEHAELAYALGEGPPVTWFSLRLRHGPVALVVGLDAGARVAPGVDAWLSALESSASPNVVPPLGTRACGEPSRVVRVAWPRSRSLAATELQVDSSDDVAAVLDAVGVSLEGPLPAAESYVIWTWPELAAPQTTRTLRVEGGAAPLTLTPGSAFPVSLSAITNGAMHYANEVDKSALDVEFVLGPHPQSDYLDRLGEFLAAGSPPLLETRARGLLFDWSIYADVLSVAPLLRTYAYQAAKELPELDAEACQEQLQALGKPGAAPLTACPGADDWALALGAVEREGATLQRLALWSQAGVESALLEAGGEPSSPLLRATSFDDSACEPAPLVPIKSDPDPPGNQGYVSPREPEPEVVVEETVVVEHEHTELSCWGSPEPEPVDQYDQGYYEDDGIDCSSDSSSSSDSSDEDCSSDTSTRSDDATDDGADCSSDTSSSSESDDGVDCSSDTSSSSSSSSDDGCSGDSSSGETSGYDGDTCTGNAAPRAEQPGAKQAALMAPGGPARGHARARRPVARRLRASVWSLAFAALVLPIRRRKRGSGAGG